MRRPRKAAERLRGAVDMLPDETKRAMLQGIQDETIVIGAYTLDGGICPMLAAHRRGGRTDFATFARAWDRYTDADKPRRATERELRTLKVMLEASLERDEVSLAAVAAELRAGRKQSGRRIPAVRWRTGVRRPTGPGWVRLRPRGKRPLRRVVAGADELDLRHDAGGRGA